MKWSSLLYREGKCTPKMVDTNIPIDFCFQSRIKNVSRGRGSGATAFSPTTPSLTATNLATFSVMTLEINKFSI
jgi:hypothetical protein